jgi:hypothetical protein
MQTSNFPPINQMEHGWSENIKAAMSFLVPGSGIRSGLVLGLPLSAGQPATGLRPTLTDGYLMMGDAVWGPYGSKLIGSGAANWANKKLYFGLSGLYYADAPAKPSDVLVGEVSTDNLNPASIMSVAQPMQYGGCRFGIRGTINLAKCTKGADVNLFTWRKSARIGLPYCRVAYAMTRVTAPVTANNAAGDDFLLKVGAKTLVTTPAATLSTVNSITVGSSDNGWVFGPETNELVFRYNQTDVAPAIASGAIEVCATIHCF